MTQLSSNNPVPTFLLLALLILVSQIGIDLYTPSLPMIKSALHTSKTMVQLTIAMFLLGFSMGQPFLGYWVDRLKKKRLIHVSLFFFIITNLMAACSPTILFLLLTRLLQGMSAGALILLIKALMVETYQGKTLAYRVSLASSIWGTVPIVAPIVGGYIEHFLGWRANFISISLFTLVVWSLCIKYLPNKSPFPRSPQPTHFIETYRLILLTPRFWGFFIPQACIYAILIAYVTISSIVLQQHLGFSAVAFGHTTILVAMGYLVGTLVNILLIRHLHLIPLIRNALCGGLTVATITPLWLLLRHAVTYTVLEFMTPLMLISLLSGLIFTNCNTLALQSFSTQPGSMSAVTGSLQMFFYAIISSSASLLPLETLLPFFILVFLLSLSGTVAFIGLIAPLTLRTTRG